MALRRDPSTEDPISIDLKDDGTNELLEKKLGMKSISFNDYLSILKGIKNKNEKVRKGSIKYFPKVVEVFEEEHGKIIYEYISDENALIQTKNNEMMHIEGILDTKSLEFLHDCDKQYIEARRLLEGDDLLCCIDRIVELVSHLFGSHERKKGDTEHSKLVDYLIIELEEIRKNLIKCAKRRARLEYYLGMVKGIGIVIVSGLFIALILNSSNRVTDLITTAILGSIILGGLGALISVMTRMSSGTLILDYEAGPKHNHILGTFRTIVGATMGLVVYILMMSELVPFKIPSEETTRIFYFLGIAFTAGFAERWAQELIPGVTEDLDKKDKNNSKDNETEIQ